MPIYENSEYIRIKRPLPDFVDRDQFDIPYIEPDQLDISDINNGKWLVSMNNLFPKDELAGRKIVHAFKDDRVLRRWYNQPFKYLHRVAPYYAVASFDFSMDESMGFPQIFMATWQNRWMGAFLQTNGKKVIPTVGWTTSDFFDLCFSGLRNGGVFFISTLGAKNEESKSDFLAGYHELRTRYPDSKIICLGNKIDGMDTDVCLVRYQDSFGCWNRRSKYWQPRLINWDGSIPERR